jgi:hypothetical protein
VRGDGQQAQTVPANVVNRQVRPAALVHVDSTMLELRPSRSRPDRGVARVCSKSRNQLGEVVQVLVAKLIVPRGGQLEMQGDPVSQE